MGISAESLQRQLRAVFAHEAVDSLSRVETLIERQRRAPADPGVLDALFREFHTMKVGAAAAGLPQAAHQLHAAESLLDAARAGAARLGEGEAIASLQRVVECVRREVGEPVGDDSPGRPLLLETLWPPLAYAIAVAAAMERKLAVLETQGGEIALDRARLDSLRGVLLHLVRNAVAHGIELPDRRQAAGKPRVGCIAVRAERHGEELLFTVADDGAGIDFAAVAAAARRRGLLAADAAPAPAALIQLLLQPGFTTRSEATELAGRGVGLDAVAATVHGLGGRMEITSPEPAGCAVRLIIPASLPVSESPKGLHRRGRRGRRGTPKNK